MWFVSWWIFCLRFEPIWKQNGLLSNNLIGSWLWLYVVCIHVWFSFSYDAVHFSCKYIHFQHKGVYLFPALLFIASTFSLPVFILIASLRCRRYHFCRPNILLFPAYPNNETHSHFTLCTIFSSYSFIIRAATTIVVYFSIFVWCTFLLLMYVCIIVLRFECVFRLHLSMCWYELLVFVQFNGFYLLR